MLTFPTHLFNPESITLKPAGAVISGGESLSGEVDTIKTDGGGYWIISMSGIDLISDAHLKAWQAWEDHLDGGVTQVLVPVPELRQAPRPIAGGVPSSPSALEATSDDPFFPEALAFASPWIIATIEGAAALRATRITIDMENGARLQGGERFAIDHATAGRRVYRVRRVLSRSGQQATISIRPPLREAVADEQAVDFDWPSVVATLLPDVDISPRIERGRYARVDISFREAFGALAPFAIAAPVVSGSAEVGQTLSCTTGTWGGNPDSYAYQWMRGDEAISGAIAPTYALVLGDLGAMISCDVTATDDKGSASAESNAVGPVDVDTTAGVLSAAGVGGFAGVADGPFDPLTLFTGAGGVWYDPSDLTSMYQTGTRAAPGAAAAVNSPVGLMLDLSGNNVDAAQVTAAARPILRQSGALYYLEFDGVDDCYDLGAFAFVDASGFSAQVGAVSFDLATGYEYLLSAEGGFDRQELRKNAATPEHLILDTVGAAYTDTAPNITAGVACVLSATLGTGKILDCRKDGVGNGTTSVTGTLNTGTATGRLGYAAGSLYFLNGNYYGGIWLSREPTAPELSGMESWAASKCGVTL